tara:strand:- start:706 stop:894 length:189 start_codon:yes stop_codon:yes gene_type:complete
MTKQTPVTFLRQVRLETKKVTWPTRKETTVTAIMVILLAIVAACFFLAADALVASLLSMILG